MTTHRRSLGALTLVAALTGLPLLTHPANATVPRSDTGIVLTRTSPRDVVTGSVVSFSATAPKRMAGDTARLQRRVGTNGKWRAVATKRVPKTGRFAISGRAASIGTNKWRLQLTTPAGNLRSNVTTSRVSKWFYLGDLDPIATEVTNFPGNCTGGCTGFYDGAAIIGGKSYPKSWLMGLSSAASHRTSLTTWNASYHCSKLSLTVGLDDSSDTTTASFTVTTDGNAQPSVSTSTGVGKAVTQTMTGVFRFSISATNTGAGADADAALGNARLLCFAHP